MIVISKFYAPYRDIVFKSSDNIKDVIYLYSSDTNRAWTNEVESNSFRLFDISTNYFELVFIIPFLSVYKRALKHDTIIVNYLNFSSIILLILCKLFKKKLFIFQMFTLII